jgi:hypothetical protein
MKEKWCLYHIVDEMPEMPLTITFYKEIDEYQQSSIEFGTKVKGWETNAASTLMLGSTCVNLDIQTRAMLESLVAKDLKVKKTDCPFTRMKNAARTRGRVGGKSNAGKLEVVGDEDDDYLDDGGHSRKSSRAYSTVSLYTVG